VSIIWTTVMACRDGTANTLAPKTVLEDSVVANQGPRMETRLAESTALLVVRLATNTIDIGEDDAASTATDTSLTSIALAEEDARAVRMLSTPEMKAPVPKKTCASCLCRRPLPLPLLCV